MSICNEGIVVAEHEFGQRLGEQRFADAGGAEEQERSHRAMRVFQAGTGAADGLADRLDRFVLGNHALVQFVFQFEQTLGFFFFQAGEGNAGHLADDLGDHFFVDDAVNFLGLLAPLPLHFFFLGAQAFGLNRGAWRLLRTRRC